MKISKISKSLLLLTLTISLLTGCTWGELVYKTERLDKLGLSVGKPEMWSSTRTESGDSYVDYIIDVPEGKNEKNSIAGKMSIDLVKALPNETVKIQDEIDGLKKLFSNNIDGLKILEEIDTTLMGLPARRVTLQFRNNEDKTTLEKAVFTVTVKDNNAYVILFDDDVADFEKYLPVYNAMAASMTLF